ncbi:MAG: hypothetical protein ACTSPY_10680 [Candidatus Helarchaeota archaeon]
MTLSDDERVHERILLLKHCFYYDSLGENESIQFMNKKLEEKGLKTVNTFQEAAYILTDSELASLLNGIAVVFPFKGQYYTFKNNHLYIQHDSSDRVLADLDRVLRIYKEDVWVILKILISVEKTDLETLRQKVSEIISSNIDFNQILGELQNNYQLVMSLIVNNKIFWKIPSEIKDLIGSQLDKIDEFQYLVEKFSLFDEKITPSMEIPPSKKNEGKTFIDLNEVLELIHDDISLSDSIEEDMKGKEKTIKRKTKKGEKHDADGKSITVEGWIKKILKNDITFKTEEGQEVRFICNRPDLIAYCIGHINKRLRFYFDVKAAELVCQKVEIAD